MGILQGKKGLVIGIANNQSIAWGCAKAFKKAGAELAITYLNEKAEPHVRPLAEQVDASIVMPLDVNNDSQMNNLFSSIEKKWGKLDFLLHAIAFAPLEDLHGKVSECSKEGFLTAMDTSCHSFMRIAHLAEPLMKNGGCMLTTTYYGGIKVVEDYGIMGPVKAALDSTVKYLAVEFGKKGIRVNSLSSGPIATRAAGGIANFNQLLETAKEKSALKKLVSIDDVGAYAKFLVSDEACLVTGSLVYIDGGFNIVAG